MKRRDFLKTGALAAAATPIAMPAIAQAMPEVKWRLTSSFPKSLDTIYGTAQQFAKLMSDATDGKFQVQTFSAGEIVPGLQALDAVTSGTVECAHTPTYFYIGKDADARARHRHPLRPQRPPAAQLVVLRRRRRRSSTTSLAKFNAYSIPCGNSGCQMGGFFRKEIKSVEDLKGLKFRIGGMGGAVLAKLGVVPTQIAAGDVYPALERGTIDAAEFVGPYDDEKLGFVRVAKYYYYPGWWEGGAMLHLVIGQEAWNKLPKHYQAIVHQACEAANNWMLAKYDAVNPGGLRRLVAQGAQLRPFPLPVMEAALKAAEEYYAETSAKNPQFKKGYDSMVAFRGENLLWWQVAELSYDSFMNRLKAR